MDGGGGLEARGNTHNFEELAGVLGFEPRVAVPKTAALPLGDTPTVERAK